MQPSICLWISIMTCLEICTAKFEEKLLNVACKYVNLNHNLPDYSHLTPDGLKLMLPEGEILVQD